MFIRKIEKHHWLQWNSVHFQMNVHFCWEIRMLLKCWLFIVVCLKTTSLEICLQLLICCWWTGCCPAACSSLFWICLFQWCIIVQKHFSFFRNHIRIPRTSTIRSEFCYFVQPCQVHPSSNKNLLSKWPMLEWCHENDWWWFLW